jgi:hypothetical protein
MKRPAILFSRVDHRDRRWIGCECQRCTPTMRPATARFLVMHSGGHVTKVKMRAGQRLQHWDCVDNGEGYTLTMRSWFFDGTTVHLQWATDATDCDGRMQRSGEGACPYSELSGGYTDPEGRRWPRWGHFNTRQRDHAAEAMGY